MEGNLLRLSIGGFAGSWIFVFALTVGVPRGGRLYVGVPNV